jgi:AcrR family transcriptional regulator
MHGEVGAGGPDARESTPGDAESLSKGERTRQRLLQLAVERFGERGYRATSVSEIARAAGLTQAAAYAYFESKRALFFAALDADASSLVLDARASVERSPVIDAPLDLLVALFDGVDRHPLARRVLAGEETEIRVFPELLELPAIRGATQVLIGRLRDGQARGEVRDDIDPVLVGAGIEAILLSILAAVVRLDRLGTERAQDGVVAAFKAMLEPPAT